MGPCFMSTEDPVDAKLVFATRTASMGPCFMSTEDLGLSMLAGMAGASMGPCFMSTEDDATSTHLH